MDRTERLARERGPALLHRFRDREDVLVAMELVVYYQRGDNTAWLRPDVRVVFGVERGGNRSTYKVWEEGKPPDFMLEVAHTLPAVPAFLPLQQRQQRQGPIVLHP